MEQNLKGKALTGFGWMFGERILAQGISFIISLLLARLLMPEEYGIVALCSVFITFANVFVSTGFGSALIQKKDADVLDYSSVLWFGIGVSIVLYLILFFVAPLIASANASYDSVTLTNVIRVMSLQLPLGAIKSVQHAHVSHELKFKKYFWSTLLGTVVSGIAGLVAAYLGWGVYALVIQTLGNSFIDMVVLFFTNRIRVVFKVSLKRVKKLFSFGNKLLVASLFDTGYQQLRAVVIGFKYSSEDLAFYNRGDGFPTLIVENINSTLQSVMFPVLSKVQDDRERGKGIMRNTIKVSSFFIMPMLVGLAAVAETLIAVLLTDKWLPCVPYLRILCIAYAFYPMNSANINAMKSIGRSDTVLRNEIIKKVIAFSLLFGLMWFGVIWVCIGVMLSTVVNSIINAFPNKKYFKYTYFDQIKDILPAVIMSFVMGGIVYAMNFIPINNIILLVIQILSGVIIYFLLAKLTKNDSLKYFLDAVKTLKNKRGKTETAKEETIVESEVNNENKEDNSVAEGELTNDVSKTPEKAEIEIISDNNENSEKVNETTTERTKNTPLSDEKSVDKEE